MTASILYFQPASRLADWKFTPACATFDLLFGATRRFLPLAYDPFLVYNFSMNKRSAQEELLACQSLVNSVAAHLALPGFSKAERQLLREAAQTVARRRQEAAARLTTIGTAAAAEPVAQQRLRENMLEAQIEALMPGHELQPWEVLADGGWQAGRLSVNSVVAPFTSATKRSTPFCQKFVWEDERPSPWKTNLKGNPMSASKKRRSLEE